MKVGVYGSATSEVSEEALKLAREIGREIARQGGIVVTGACVGLPQEAVLGAKEVGGKTFGFSVATNLDNHMKSEGSATKGIDNFNFIPQNFEYKDNLLVCRKYRNVSSTAYVDCAIIVGGRIGTMNEFTNLYDMAKNIGVLLNTGGITESAVKVLLRESKKESDSLVIYESDPIVLVRNLLKKRK